MLEAQVHAVHREHTAGPFPRAAAARELNGEVDDLEEHAAINYLVSDGHSLVRSIPNRGARYFLVEQMAARVVAVRDPVPTRHLAMTTLPRARAAIGKAAPEESAGEHGHVAFDGLQS